MQKSKHNRKFRRRVVSLLTLVLILVPMVALAVYAGSSSSEFSFSFNYVNDTDYDRAYKSDVGSSSGYYAQVNVTGAYFSGGGSASMHVERTNGTRVTDNETVTGTCTKYLYYYTGSLATNAYVDLTATLTSGSGGGFSGIWWP
ncbi:MAG TPA: hypothetical protein IAB92_05050 [Candidatus Faecousia faecigallinarum]|nr:hypothetical protein [Candidatus Faecousia faecigallinarum]